MSIIPLPSADEPPLTADIDALAFVMSQTEPDLWVRGRLPKETLESFHARREAARDILDSLLSEFAAEVSA
ncbi:MAG TPA: hypothetical protein VIP77_19405 [Jiangellaceae bacterium]